MKRERERDKKKNQTYLFPKRWWETRRSILLCDYIGHDFFLREKEKWKKNLFWKFLDFWILGLSSTHFLSLETQIFTESHRTKLLGGDRFFCVGRMPTSMTCFFLYFLRLAFELFSVWPIVEKRAIRNNLKFLSHFFWMIFTLIIQIRIEKNELPFFSFFAL